MLQCAQMKIENKAITAISISVDFGVTNYCVCDTGKKRGMFFAAERNAINVEIQAFRNLTYNAALRARRGSSIESKNKFYPPVLPLAQQIVFDKYLLFARSGLLPPNTIVPRKLVLPRPKNSSESIHAKVRDPDTFGPYLLKGQSPLIVVNGRNGKTGFRHWFPTLKLSIFIHDVPTGSARHSLVYTPRRCFQRLMKRTNTVICEISHFYRRKDVNEKKINSFI